MILTNALIINEGEQFAGYVIIKGEKIAEVGHGVFSDATDEEIIDLKGKILIPGVIDTHVHFREPGLTSKADISTESLAAIAGGVTSYFDMPNCIPPTTTYQEWEQKMKIASRNSAANYAFYIGATADNIETLKGIDKTKVPGIKAFLGQSTGSMQVADDALDQIFSLPNIISVHAEDQSIIDSNVEFARLKYKYEEVPVLEHPNIRSVEACLKSTTEAINRASKLNTRLHICHVSTQEETQLIETAKSKNDRLTAEACVTHLWFDSDDYQRLGAKIKCNPAIKARRHRDALREAVANGTIDVVSTDHAPHLPADKNGGALSAASGIPSVQFSLPAMYELSLQGYFTLERVVDVMCHNQAKLFGIEKRGYIREGYYADLVVINPEGETHVTPEIIKSKCGWSPFEGVTFHCAIDRVFVNGHSPEPGIAHPIILCG